MRPKTLGRLPAQPVIARIMLITAPIPTDTKGLTLGRVVLKLLAAMNDEKQAPGNEARVNPSIMAANKPEESFAFKAAVMLKVAGSRTPVALAPATAITEMPAVKTIAMMTPTIPPILTSFASRLLLQISTPAAPAVAKNPTMAATIANMLAVPPPDSVGVGL